MTRLAKLPPVTPQWLMMGTRSPSGSRATSRHRMTASLSLATKAMASAPAARSDWYFSSIVWSPHWYHSIPTDWGSLASR